MISVRHPWSMFTVDRSLLVSSQIMGIRTRHELARSDPKENRTARHAISDPRQDETQDPEFQTLVESGRRSIMRNNLTDGVPAI